MRFETSHTDGVPLDFGLGWSEFASDYRVGEGACAVRAVAKWLVGGLPTTAEADRGAARQTENAALRVDNLEVPLYA